MSNTDAMSVSARIAADKTFAALFDTIRDHGDAPAAGLIIASKVIRDLIQ